MVIRNRLLPPSQFLAINLLGIIFTRSRSPLPAATLQHERIHTAQMLELLVVGFYVWYVAEWLVRLVHQRNAFAAYRAIRFEREAYAHQHDADYLKHRRPWAWLKK